MDKKSTLTAGLVSAVVILAWVGGNMYLRAKHPAWFLPAAVPVAQTQPAAVTPPDQPPVPATGSAATGPSATGPSALGPAISTTGPTAATAPARPAGFAVASVAAGAAKPAVLGSAAIDDPTYAMQVRLSPAGGGIDGVTLNQFRRSEDFKLKPTDRRVYEFQQPYDPALYGYARSMGTRFVTVNGTPVDVASAAWALTAAGEHERAIVSPGATGGPAPGWRKVAGPFATYSATVTNDGAPVLELIKTYTLFAKAVAAEGYEVAVDYAVRNVSGGELTVGQTINGPTLPPREASRPPDRQVVAGYRATDGTIAIDHPHPVESFVAGKPTIDLTKDKENRPVAWAGASSVYFDAYLLFEQPGEIAKVAAEAKELESQPNAELRPVLLTVDTAPAKLAPGETKTTSMSAFFGPRWRKVLNVGHYAAAPRDYDQTLIVKSGPCGFCAFDWLIAALVWLLNSFQFLAGGFAGAGDWGIAIILLVALVRTCLHPITKRSQMQMMKMGKMGPELAKLKDKYGDDKEAYTKAQMEVMKSQGIGPLLGCLPMFLQMPIWIALWQALQSTFELRQAPFLWGFTWIKDLSKPDYFIKADWNVDLFFGLHIDGLNLLPLLMSVIFYVQMTIQQKLQPPPATPEQAQQQKMMKYMSTFLFPLFLYNGPSGLNLYILTSTLVGIIESKVIRDHIKQREAAEKAAGPVVVDAPLARTTRRGRDGAVVEPDKKPSGLVGLFQKLQKRVEDIQREQERRGGGKAK